MMYTINWLNRDFVQVVAMADRERGCGFDFDECIAYLDAAGMYQVQGKQRPAKTSRTQATHDR